MIILPMPMPSGSSEPDRCPHCGQVEQVTQTCAHCGYHYPESDVRVWPFVVGLGVTILVAALGVAMMLNTFGVFYCWVESSWDCPSWPRGNRTTLVECIECQWDKATDPFSRLW